MSRVAGHCGSKEVRELNIGVAVFLIALGAILKYAVTGGVAGISLATVGLILMIAGAIELATSILRRWANGADSERVSPRRAA